MHIEESDVLGNQSPLDYIAAIRDIYLPLKTGCSTAIIPKEYFMEPNALFDYMNDKKVSSVGWSVSAFTILTSLGAFEEVGLKSLRKICFSGSVMPCNLKRHLRLRRLVRGHAGTGLPRFIGQEADISRRIPHQDQHVNRRVSVTHRRAGTVVTDRTHIIHPIVQRIPGRALSVLRSLHRE